jgi:hypothetical protein
MSADFLNDGRYVTLWGALVLFVACAVLLIAAIAAKDPGADTRREDQPSDLHKPPPHYTLDDWT